MGVLTKLGMVDEVRYQMENRQDISATRIKRWLDWAYLHVSMPNIYRHRQLQDTEDIALVLADDTYTLASDITAVYSVANTTKGYRLEPQDIRWFDELRQIDAQPRVYSLWGNVLHIRGRPTSAEAGDNLRIRHWARPDLSAFGDNDETILDQVWDEVVILGAVWRGWRTLNRPDMEDLAREVFSLSINEIVDIDRVEGEDDGRRFEPEIYNYEVRSA